MLIKQVIKPYRGRLSLTLLLIIVEALLGILFPLFIGKAIDGIINQELMYFWQLAVLGLLLIIIGGSRRLFDSRFYAKVYVRLSRATINKMESSDNSIKTARLNMLAEMVNFAENQLPEIIQHSIGLVAVASIIGFLNFQIFIGALICGFIVLGLYLLSSKKTLRYNAEFNNELESQVNVIDSKRQSALKLHLLKLMKWNIRLSDLETINYSGSWIIMLVLLMASIYVSVSGDNIQYGALLASIMYVYQFIESMVSLPLYYQQWLRLYEITDRIRTV
ncbi:MAG: ABC transporter six-transmembrane domain-containing protein [Chlorobiales bacterium]|nr:ABC transporter six-transmembrane domain-containing protein [Chlorobiales bacterium]